MGNNGKRYDTEFRADATRLVKENGRSVASVAKDLGINKTYFFGVINTFLSISIFSSTFPVPRATARRGSSQT
jgi:predicted DNA-binding ArsR family transcriptional regulator